MDLLFRAVEQGVWLQYFSKYSWWEADKVFGAQNSYGNNFYMGAELRAATMLEF